MILKQASWSMIGSIYGFVVGFFLKIYLINAVGTEGYGKYIIAMGVISTITAFIALSIPQVLLRFLPAYIEKKEYEKASNLASFSLQFLLGIGSIVALLVFLFHNQISLIFHDHDKLLSLVIMFSAFYIPLSLYQSIMSASYRSLLKIREIILYGTFVMITLRALSVFIIYSFATSIYYFIFIELITQLIVLYLLTKKFDTSKFTFFKPFPMKEIIQDKQIIDYGKKMYFYALIGIAGGYTISLIMSLYLPASDIGIYAILGTLGGLTAFLLNNLNSVFAPVISKYHAAGEIEKLGMLFKDTTFVINIVSAPFIVLLILFSHDILSLYGHHVSDYTLALAVLILGSYYNLFVGNSGMLLLMGGWENDEIKIKIGNTIFLILSSLIFISEFGLIAAVWISTVSSFLVNSFHVFFIKKRFGFTPWEKYSLFIFIATIGVIYYFGFRTFPYKYSIFDYIWVGLLVPLAYWLPFYKKIMAIIKTIKENK
ncbi:oligosaccharide flippase family protein [Hydrogenimonas cancrithermarum]|nr:oligosaccharide flippase family protein [Hydrogenimonas cancrithermarum]